MLAAILAFLRSNQAGFVRCTLTTTFLGHWIPLADTMGLFLGPTEPSIRRVQTYMLADRPLDAQTPIGVFGSLGASAGRAVRRAVARSIAGRLRLDLQGRHDPNEFLVPLSNASNGGYSCGIA
jgi:hypothetical protein